MVFIKIRSREKMVMNVAVIPLKTTIKREKEREIKMSDSNLQNVDTYTILLSFYFYCRTCRYN